MERANKTCATHTEVFSPYPSVLQGLHTQNQQLETRPTAFDEEESQNHDEPVLGDDAGDELNPFEAHSSSAGDSTDPLSAHGQQWELLQGVVTECQRSKDGWWFKEM